MYAKAIGFAVILLLGGGLVLDRSPQITTVALLMIIAWASARLYYFFFYVIERYIDPEFRFAGLIDAMRYVLTGRGDRASRRTKP
jgi:hypothetical protein